MSPFRFIECGTQSTLQEPVTLRGNAFFESKSARVTLCPAPPDTGIVFDIEDRGIIPARADHLASDSCFSNTTVLADGDARVITPEHFLSAAYGLGIENLRVKLDEHGHLPSLDGSSFGYCDAILSSGISDQDKKRQVLEVTSEVEVRKDGRSIKLGPPEGNKTHVEATIAYDEPIGTQKISCEIGRSSYCLRLAWARTFAYNPFSGRSTLNEKLPGFRLEDDHFIDSNMILYTEDGYITDLRREDEPVRHKVLDFIGDIALCGVPLIGSMRLFKPGHSINHLAVQKILGQISTQGVLEKLDCRPDQE